MRWDLSSLDVVEGGRIDVVEDSVGVCFNRGWTELGCSELLLNIVPCFVKGMTGNRGSRGDVCP